MILLDKADVWKYFTEKRSYLKILNKILKKDEEAADTLKESLKDIGQELRTK